MKTYKQIKDDYQKATNDIIEKYQVFFAFSDKQLQEGKDKINIQSNTDLLSISAGGFIPKVNSSLFFDAMELAEKNYKQAIKQAKEAKEEAILYELNNHEAFYTQRLDEVIEKFDGIYTIQDIKAVFNKFNK